MGISSKILNKPEFDHTSFAICHLTKLLTFPIHAILYAYDNLFPLTPALEKKVIKHKFLKGSRTNKMM
jgi:hypothetical protein